MPTLISGPPNLSQDLGHLTKVFFGKRLRMSNQTSLTPSSVEISVVTLEQGAVRTTDARNLHKHLNIRKDFSDWIKAQISRADLKDGEDYIVCSLKSEQETAQIPDSPKKGRTFP